MRLIIPLIVLLLGIFHSSNAQVHRKIKEHGDLLMKKGDYNGAVKYYRSALNVDSSEVDLVFSYAQSLRLTNNYKKALFYYSKTSTLDKRRQFIQSHHYAAELYKVLGNYNKAQKEHRRFVRMYKGNRTDYIYLKSKYELKQARAFEHLRKDSVEIDLDNDHPVNTYYSEISPYLVNKESLLFSSLRSDSTKNLRVLDTALYYSRLYQSEYKENWSSGKMHSDFDNNEKIHLANSSYTPKHESVYYTECESSGSCKIYKARNDQGKWMDFQELPAQINLPGSNNTQPFVARLNGFDILFFVSDRPGGKGKLDIWYSISYSNGIYDDPINLGDSVNSPGNDICPFFMQDEQALYFSSDWYVGFGGFDIFRSKMTGSAYLSPENLGLPMNSSYNDLYFNYHDGKGVISSNRIGSITDRYKNCCNDLYFFDYKPKQIVTASEMNNMEKIERMLPLRLFFENDQPNPRSEDTVTKVIYGSSYINYISALPIYQREYSKGLKKENKENAEEEIYYFFEKEVEGGYQDLKEALKLILKELENGGNIEIAIKGFASPLSHSEYNRNLTLRRIKSVENEIYHFNLGSLRKYLSENKLKIVRYPFGEDLVSPKVSDDRNDKRNAIYSKQAAFERRVEIIRVSEN